MAGLEIDRKQLMVVIMVAAVGAGAAFWMLWRNKKVEQITAHQTTLDSLNRQIAVAQRDLRRGTVEDLRRTIAEYEAGLELMRQLVPEGAEVPTLIDDIRARAGRRGVRIGEIGAPSVEPGQPFDEHRFRVTVFGRYDAIGEFLTDVASLPRIMVPVGLTLDTATQVAQRSYGDTTGGLLEAQFQIRTYVKSRAQPSPGGER